MDTLDKIVSRTIRQAHDFDVTGRTHPAWLDKQLAAIEEMGHDWQRGYASMANALHDELDILDALEKQT